MKRIVSSIVVLLLSVSIMGCDSGMKIVKMDIKAFPDRIVYVCNQDKELDLSGGVLEYTLKEGSKAESEMNDLAITVSHSISFDKPGVYVVELKRGEFQCKFPVEVISKYPYEN